MLKNILFLDEILPFILLTDNYDLLIPVIEAGIVSMDNLSDVNDDEYDRVIRSFRRYPEKIKRFLISNKEFVRYNPDAADSILESFGEKMTDYFTIAEIKKMDE